MSTRDTLLIPDPACLPAALREPLDGVSFATYLFVEASRLDDLSLPAVLGWLGVRASAFAQVEARWSQIVADALADEALAFDALYDELLGRALACWPRPVDPLDRDVQAWIMFQRHALASMDPGDVGRRLGLTAGDELRLARAWRGPLAIPETAARAASAWSSPLLPLPGLSLPKLLFPPALEST